MNKVMLIGRLTKIPELKSTQGGNVVARFTLAVNRPYSRDKESQADFINIICWGNRAKAVGEYLDKGSKVCVFGRIQTGSYTAADGSKRYTTDVYAKEIEFLENKQSNNSYNRSDTDTPDSGGFIGYDEIDELDVPF